MITQSIVILAALAPLFSAQAGTSQSAHQSCPDFSGSYSVPTRDQCEGMIDEQVQTFHILTHAEHRPGDLGAADVLPGSIVILEQKGCEELLVRYLDSNTHSPAVVTVPFENPPHKFGRWKISRNKIAFAWKGTESHGYGGWSHEYYLDSWTKTRDGDIRIQRIYRDLLFWGPFPALLESDSEKCLLRKAPG